MAHLNAPAEFFAYVCGVLASEPAIDPCWSADHLSVVFPKKSENGFDIEVAYDPSSNVLELQTDRGYHDHYHVAKFDSFSAALACVFGLVRDLLSPNMRIEETTSNGRPRKWKLQSRTNGQWVTESTAGLLMWNIFGRESTVAYSNHVLPSREFTPDA